MLIQCALHVARAHRRSRPPSGSSTDRSMAGGSEDTHCASGTFTAARLEATAAGAKITISRITKVIGCILFVLFSSGVSSDLASPASEGV